MKNYFFPSLLSLCLLAGLTPASAQSKRGAKDSSVVIIFQETKAPSSGTKKGSSEGNILKIAPLGFISGTFPILYERRISDFFTLQAGGGLTNKNYYRTLYMGASEGFSEGKYPWDDYNYYDQADGLYNFDNRTPQMGHMYSIEPRIYFESEAPEGSFLGLTYQYARYNFQIPALVANTSNGGYDHKGAPVKEYENIRDVMIHFGGQQLFDRISLEYSTAIGIRKIAGTKYAAYDNGTTLVEELAPYKENRLNFAIGLKVGYHF